MAEQGNQFSDDAARKIARVVHQVLGEPLTSPEARDFRHQGETNTVFLRVTSSTACNDNYPAVIVFLEPDGTWTDGDPVWARGPNDEALTEGTRYTARLAARAASEPDPGVDCPSLEEMSDESPIYVVIIGGGEGLSISGAFDTIEQDCFSACSVEPSGYSGINELEFDECHFQLSKPGEAKVTIGLPGSDTNLTLMSGDCCCIELCFSGGLLIGTCLVDECPDTGCAGDEGCGDE